MGPVTVTAGCEPGSWARRWIPLPGARGGPAWPLAGCHPDRVWPAEHACSWDCCGTSKSTTIKASPAIEEYIWIEGPLTLGWWGDSCTLLCYILGKFRNFFPATDEIKHCSKTGGTWVALLIREVSDSPAPAASAVRLFRASNNRSRNWTTTQQHFVQQKHLTNSE